jgi:hypothetical protein
MKHSPHVKHNQIEETPNGTYSMANRDFHLQDIVQYYSTHSGGLGCALIQPIPKPKPGILPAGRSDEIDRNDLKNSQTVRQW